MQISSLIRDIFLDSEVEKVGNLYSPKNLTDHYRVELRHVEFDEVCVGGNYKDLEKKIDRYKYHSDRELSTYFVEVLAGCVEVSSYFGEHDDWCVVPIPMHWSRYLTRGFDHIGLLARLFSRRYSLEYLPLLGSRYRKHQSRLTRGERIVNKKDSFFIKSRYTIPSHIILIDDVVSSGSTLHEAAKLLKAHGAKVVICFTLASNAEMS